MIPRRDPVIEAKRRQQILAVLAEKPRPMKVIEEEVGMSHSVVFERVHRMMAEGLIHRTARGCSYIYAIGAKP